MVEKFTRRRSTSPFFFKFTTFCLANYYIYVLQWQLLTATLLYSTVHSRHTNIYLPTYIISNCYTTALMTNKATDDEIIIMKEVANADIHLLHGSS